MGGDRVDENYAYGSKGATGVNYTYGDSGKDHYRRGASSSWGNYDEKQSEKRRLDAGGDSCSRKARKEESTTRASGSTADHDADSSWGSWTGSAKGNRPRSGDTRSARASAMPRGVLERNVQRL